MATKTQKSEPAQDPVKTVARLVSKYDEEMCKAWLEEIDTLMLFVSRYTLSTANC